MTKTEAEMYRSKLDGVLTKLTDEEALDNKMLYKAWSGYVNYDVGAIVRSNGTLYKCYNAITANTTWLPENTPAHWEVIRVTETGTIDNPITASANMRYYKDLYYKEDSKIYKCVRDDSNGNGTLLAYLPSQLVGIYFEEVN